MSRPPKPLAERFWKMVQKTDGCWLWTGAITGPTPGSRYGHITDAKGKVSGAHRVSYELHYGPIPLGLLVCHTCDNGGCVRPDHLFLGTHGDNSSDMIAKGRSYHQQRTHCPSGHTLDGKNLNGSRYCKTCHRDRQRERERRLRSACVGKGIPCACGCGQTTNADENTGEPFRWIVGHHPRMGVAQRAIGV